VRPHPRDAQSLAETRLVGAGRPSAVIRQAGRVARLPRALARRPRQTLRYFREAGADQVLFVRYRRQHPDEAALIDRITTLKLTFLRRRNLADLAEAVKRADRDNIPGLIIEAGTALGGSAILMAKLKRPARPLVVYDAFGMIPAPSERDEHDVHERYAKIASGRAEGIGGEAYYGYRDDLLGDVTRSFARFGVSLERDHVSLIAGFFDDTLRVSEPVAVAHIDADWYDSVMTCLRRIGPYLAPGGRFVIDDYYSYSGCRHAVDQYLADNPDLYRREKHSRLHLVRELPG
jgi:O-methyltransferase